MILYGPVESQEEKKRIESDAAAVVKVGNVFSELVVRPRQNLSQTKSSRRHELNDERSTEEECGRIRRPKNLHRRWMAYDQAVTSVWPIEGIAESTIQFCNPGVLIPAPHQPSGKSR
jgi:hypothetical protein